MARLEPPLRLYRGPADLASIYKGYEGEPTYDKDKKTIRIHDGVNVGGFSLAREDRQILAGDSIIKVEGPGDLSGDTTIKLDPDKVAEWNLKEATYVDTIPTDETQFEEFISGLDEGAIVVETSGSGSANVVGLTPAEAAHAAMPSGKYINLPTPSSGTTYTVVADGYLLLSGLSSAISQGIQLQTRSSGIGSTVVSTASGQYIYTTIPVSKGATVAVGINSGVSNVVFRFVYCNGSAPE